MKKRLFIIVTVVLCGLIFIVPIAGCYNGDASRYRITELEDTIYRLQAERHSYRVKLTEQLDENNRLLLQILANATENEELAAKNAGIIAQLQATILELENRISQLQNQIQNGGEQPSKPPSSSTDPSEPQPIVIGDFTLSHAPGIYEEEFDLTITHNNSAAVIYFTIDGTEPMVGGARFIQRNVPSATSTVGFFTQADGRVLVADRVPASGIMPVRDNSVSHWHWYSLLSRHTSNTTGYGGSSGGIPPSGASLRQGTAFTFRAFVDGEAVGDSISTTFMVWNGFAKTFNNAPVIAITAPYDDFLAVYRDTATYSGIAVPAVRRNFNYEFFEFDAAANGYNRIFSMVGSSQLGGRGSRGNPQRTINVHLARGDLNGHITHPVFAGLEDLTRFRLWNGGNSFWWCHLRDPFMQTAAKRAGINALTADYRLAIKIVNGEFWGFTTLREHTSNNFFTATRADIYPRNNVLITDTGWHVVPGQANTHRRYTEIEEGGADTEAAYLAVWNFVRNADLGLDENRERLFREFVCEENLIDYLIVNTFFQNNDWSRNNVRAFRARNPNPGHSNPNMDGRWRFILHDMDRAMPFAAGLPGVWGRGVNEDTIAYRITNRTFHADRDVWPRVFTVVNNRYFAQKMQARALELLAGGLSQNALTSLLNDMQAERRPLLDEHYNRFSMHNRTDVQGSLANWNAHITALQNWINQRHTHYRVHLQNMVNRGRS